MNPSVVRVIRGAAVIRSCRWHTIRKILRRHPLHPLRHALLKTQIRYIETASTPTPMLRANHVMEVLTRFGRTAMSMPMTMCRRFNCKDTWARFASAPSVTETTHSRTERLTVLTVCTPSMTLNGSKERVTAGMGILRKTKAARIVVLRVTGPTTWGRALRGFRSIESYVMGREGSAQH